MRITSNNYLIETAEIQKATQWFISEFPESKEFNILKFEFFSFRKNDAAYLREILQQKGSRNIYFVSFYVTNNEAQNVLLKTTEELSNDLLVLVLFDRNILLPTILSRFVVHKPSIVHYLDKAKAKEFLALDYNSRIKYLNKLRQDEIGKIELAKLIFSLQDYFFNTRDPFKIKLVLQVSRNYFKDVNPSRASIESLAFL